MLELRIEKIRELSEELKGLALAHYDEVGYSGKDKGPDYQGMGTLEDIGIFKLLTARKDGELVGYLSWVMAFDLLSYGDLKAEQCAWYVTPGNPKVAYLMFQAATEELKRLGVKSMNWHHFNKGRGASLGRFFEKQSGVLTKLTYTVRL